MIKWEHCREIKTYDKAHKQNGSIIELFKKSTKTEVYITIIKPGAIKGYHIHNKRTNRFVCIKGRVMIHYKEPDQQIFSVVLEDTILERIVIPPHVFIAIENPGNKDAWLLNYPDPPYDPNDNEQKTVERKDVV